MREIQDILNKDEEILWQKAFIDEVKYLHFKRLTRNINFYMIGFCIIFLINVLSILFRFRIILILNILILCITFSLFLISLPSKKKSPKKPQIISEKKQELYRKSYLITKKRVINNSFHGKYKFPSVPPEDIVKMEKDFIAINLKVVYEFQIECRENYFDLICVFNVDDKDFYLPLENIVINEKNNVQSVLTKDLQYEFELDEDKNIEYYSLLKKS